MKSLFKDRVCFHLQSKIAIYMCPFFAGHLRGNIRTKTWKVLFWTISCDQKLPFICVLFFCRLSSNNSRVPPRVWLPALRTFQALLAVMANIVIQHRRFLPKLYWQTLSKLKKYFVKLQLHYNYEKNCE